MKTIFNKQETCNCEGIAKKISVVILLICSCIGIYNFIVGIKNIETDYEFVNTNQSELDSIDKEHDFRLSQIECLKNKDYVAYAEERSKITDWYCDAYKPKQEMQIIKTWEPEWDKIQYGLILLFGGTLIFCLIQILCNISIKLN